MTRVSKSLCARLLLTACIALPTPFAAIAIAEEPTENSSRQLWAYPRGIIVTTTLFAATRMKNSQLREDLEALAGAIEPDFADCLANLRDRRADLRGAPRISMTLKVTITDDGTISSVEPNRRPIPELVECAARAMVSVRAYKTSPLPADSEPKPMIARIILDGVLLTDAEAKGKGFLFYEAETRWERELRAHPEWQRCSKDSECTVIQERCELHAVHIDHVADYRTAMQPRQERSCRVDDAPTERRAECIRRRCKI